MCIGAIMASHGFYRHARSARSPAARARGSRCAAGRGLRPRLREGLREEEGAAAGARRRTGAQAIDARQRRDRGAGCASTSSSSTPTTRDASPSAGAPRPALMKRLQAFHPYLTGAVWKGIVTEHAPMSNSSTTTRRTWRSNCSTGVDYLRPCRTSAAAPRSRRWLLSRRRTGAAVVCTVTTTFAARCAAAPRVPSGAIATRCSSGSSRRHEPPALAGLGRAGAPAASAPGSRRAVTRSATPTAPRSSCCCTGSPCPTPTARPPHWLRGQPAVVNFWATWCPPCVEEMPELSAFGDEFRDRGLRIVGIGIDSATNISQFSRKTPMSYPLLVAGTSGLELVRRLGNTAGALPFTVVVGRTGESPGARWDASGLRSCAKPSCASSEPLAPGSPGAHHWRRVPNRRIKAHNFAQLRLTPSIFECQDCSGSSMART